MPPYTIEYNRNQEPVSLGKKFEIYCNNRRNKQQVLKRAALPCDSNLEEFGLGDSGWANRNVIDLTSVDSKSQKRMQARSDWLRTLDATTQVSIKQEPKEGTPEASITDDPPLSDEPVLDDPPPPPPGATTFPAAKLDGKQRKRPLGSQVDNSKSAGQVKSTKAVDNATKEMLAKERSDSARAQQNAKADADAQQADEADGDPSDDQENRRSKPAKDQQPSPEPTKAKKSVSKKQSKIKPMRLKPREILTSDPLFAQEPSEPPLEKSNAGGRYVLAPASQWEDCAQKDSGGFIGKFLKVINSSAQIQFQDGKVWFTWEVAAQFKPLS